MTIKRRIMSRAEIAATLLDRIDRVENYSEKFEQANNDFMFHLIADGSTVKIYVDKDMGGTVVEF